MDAKKTVLEKSHCLSKSLIPSSRIKPVLIVQNKNLKKHIEEHTKPKYQTTRLKEPTKIGWWLNHNPSKKYLSKIGSIFPNFRGENHHLEYMGVSKNGGTPKSSILIGFSILNRPFWGTTIVGNTPICPPFGLFTLSFRRMILRCDFHRNLQRAAQRFPRAALRHFGLAQQQPGQIGRFLRTGFGGFLKLKKTNN